MEKYTKETRKKTFRSASTSRARIALGTRGDAAVRSNGTSASDALVRDIRTEVPRYRRPEDSPVALAAATHHIAQLRNACCRFLYNSRARSDITS